MLHTAIVPSRVLPSKSIKSTLEIIPKHSKNPSQLCPVTRRVQQLSLYTTPLNSLIKLYSVDHQFFALYYDALHLHAIVVDVLKSFRPKGTFLVFSVDANCNVGTSNILRDRDSYVMDRQLRKQMHKHVCIMYKHSDVR